MGKVTLGIWTERNGRLADKIKSLRVYRRIQVSELAKRARVNSGTYHCHMKNPDLITVAELRTYIKELKIPEEEILYALYLDKRCPDEG